MNLVLLVHNNLTFQFALKAAAHFRIAPENCLWIRDRNVRIPDEYRFSFDLSRAPLSEFRLADWFKWTALARENHCSLQILDRQLAGFAPEGFHLVLPHSYDLRYHALLTSALCKGFYYLEEGKLSCAGDPERPRSWKKPVVALGHLFFLKGRVPAFPPPFSLDHPKYLGALAFSRFAFRGFGNRIALQLPFQKRPELEHYRHVLVLGPYVEFGELPQAVETQVLEEVAAWLTEQEIGKLYVKFHPAQLNKNLSAPVIRSLLNRFSTTLGWEEIPPEVSLEELAASAHPDIYLATSSVAIYALAAGARVHTYAHRLIAVYPAFRKVWEDLPTDIRNAMSPIPLDH